MKVRFFLKTPPGGKEPVDYIEIDADDTGKNVIGRQATDADKDRFSEEYERFEEEREKGEVSPEDVPVRVPPSLAAAANIGQDRTPELASGGPLSTPASDERAALGDKGVLLSDAKVAIGTSDMTLQKPGVSGSDEESSSSGESGSGESLQSMTVEEALPYVRSVDDPDQLERLRKEEEKGKARVTVLDAIDQHQNAVERQKSKE